MTSCVPPATKFYPVTNGKSPVTSVQLKEAIHREIQSWFQKNPRNSGTKHLSWEFVLCTVKTVTHLSLCGISIQWLTRCVFPYSFEELIATHWFLPSNAPTFCNQVIPFHLLGTYTDRIGFPFFIARSPLSGWFWSLLSTLAVFYITGSENSFSRTEKKPRIFANALDR